MSAIYRINQDGVDGSWGIARADLQLVGAGGSVTLEAQDTMSTYLWELLSIPEGSSASIVSPTTQSATLDIDVTGGYLVRLTVDAGLSTQDLLVLYLGVPLAYSNVAIPAFNETSFDNRYTGYEGYERKLTTLYKWIDTAISNLNTGTKLVNVSAADTTADYLSDKLFAGTGMTLSIVNPGGDEQVRLDSSGGIESPENTYYIDILNGSDSTGDGKPGTPYKTLSYAIAQVGQPADGAAYMEPQTFVLKKGTYPDNVVLPTYQQVIVLLEEAVVTGAIDWHLDRTYLYGLDPVTFMPRLGIRGKYSGAAVTDIEVKNGNTSAGVLTYKVLALTDVELLGHLINEETGDGSVASGMLYLKMNRTVSARTSSKRLGGRYESVMGIGSAPNTIYLEAINCILTGHTICGCTQIVYSSETLFRNADYRSDPSIGGTSYTGCIEGGTSVHSKGMTSTWWDTLVDSHFGSTVVTPKPFTGDAYTMARLLTESAPSGSYFFTGFAVDPDQPYDWWRVRDRAEGVGVNSTPFTQYLSGLRTVQECLERVDTLALYLVTVLTANYTVVAADNGKYFLVSSGTPPVVVTLPDTPTVGFVVTVGTTGVRIRVAASGSDNIMMPGALAASSQVETEVSGSVSKFVYFGSNTWGMAPAQGRWIDDIDTPTKVYVYDGHVEGATQNNLASFDAYGNIQDSGAATANLAVYSQDAEPTLAADGNVAMWVDTNDSNRVWLLYRRGSGDQVKVELS